LAIYRWGYHRAGGYAARSIGAGNGKQKTVLMHRQILGVAKGLSTDHINGNGLDNRRFNLRICSHADNLKNQKLHSNNTSGIRGVSWHCGKSSWNVRIQTNGNSIFLGYYQSIEEAKRAYAFGSILLHGEFRRPTP